VSTVARRLSFVGFSSALAVLLAATLATRGSTPEPQAQDSTDANVPKGQTYLGSKQCASCHFEQFLSWRKTKHTEGFDILPAKYKKDASCLKCHSTGYGEPTGYTDGNTALAGTTCEACHGPGSKHAEIAKPFAKKKNLTKEEEAQARGSIYKILPDVACLHCHEAQQHKEHPPYDKS
jgi:hypothetical protein